MARSRPTMQQVLGAAEQSPLRRRGQPVLKVFEAI